MAVSLHGTIGGNEGSLQPHLPLGSLILSLQGADLLGESLARLANSMILSSASSGTGNTFLDLLSGINASEGTKQGCPSQFSAGSDE